MLIYADMPRAAVKPRKIGEVPLPMKSRVCFLPSTVKSVSTRLERRSSASHSDSGLIKLCNSPFGGSLLMRHIPGRVMSLERHGSSSVED